MAKLRTQPKDREIAIRARNMDSMLDGRIYVCKAGVYLVEGKPRFNTLLHCLQSIEELPRPGEEPGPIQLGFTPTQIMPVTKDLLADFGRALQKWRKIIADKDLRKPKKASTREELRLWKDETDFLGERLDCLHRHLKAFITNSCYPTQYVPADATRLDVAESARFVITSKHVSAVVQWYGLIVSWLSGSNALARFFSALKPVLLSPHEKNKSEIARHIHEIFTLRLNKMGLSDTSAFKRSLTGEIRLKLEQFPQDFLTMIGLQPPSRPHELIDYLLQSIKKCEEILEGLQKLPNRKQIAGIAALCAFDFCTVPIPSCLIEKRIKSENLNPLLAALARESSENGYDLLLKEFNIVGGSS